VVQFCSTGDEVDEVEVERVEEVEEVQDVVPVLAVVEVEEVERVEDAPVVPVDPVEPVKDAHPVARTYVVEHPWKMYGVHWPTHMVKSQPQLDWRRRLLHTVSV
jgi:hypothetical protein